MRTLLLALAAVIGSTAPAQAAPPATPQAWRAAAAQDLTAIHDVLRDNSPAMVVDRDSAHFREWLETGLQQARSGLAQVHDARGYYYALKGYAVGFRDSHISVWPSKTSGVTLDAVAWPGFALTFSGGEYRVAEPRSSDPDAPPARALLLGCDGFDVETMLVQRDRFDGDLHLARTHVSAAKNLLMDRGDPFVARPKVCQFASAAQTRSYRLRWHTLTAQRAQDIDKQIMARPARSLGLEAWGPQRWWITLPSMEGNQDWNGLYAQVRGQRDALRAADLIVIDVRGNGGGDSSFGDRLARLIWGDALVDRHAPDLGPTVWRVSPLNRAYWVGITAQIAGDPQYAADTKADMQTILARFDAALAAHQPTFELADDAPPPRTGDTPDPVHGHVLILTDAACNSACLDLLDQFLAIPGVQQAGSTTAADTIFMELTIVPALPSGQASMGFGHKAWVKRPRPSNIPYTPLPSLTWTGDMRDTAAIRAWLGALYPTH